MRTTLMGRASARSLMGEPPTVLDEDDTPARAAAEMARTGSTVLPVTRRPGAPHAGDDAGARPDAAGTGAGGGAATGDDAGARPDAAAKADDPAKAARPDGTPSDVGDRVLLGCLDAVTLARISLTGRAVERVGELPLSEHHILASDGATGVLGALVRDGFSALPVVEARPRGGFTLVGWVTREQMVERVYRQQRRAFEEAQVRTSLGARVQQRWRGRSARG